MSVRDRLIQLTLRARNFLSGDVAPATESMRELTEEGRRLKASMDDVGRARGLARTLRDNQQATEGLARSQADARATLDDLTREIGDNATATAGQRIALREARQTLEEAERAYKRNQQAIKNTTSELKKLGVDTDNVVAEEKRLTGELDDGKRALAANREAIREKRVEEKKAADTAKEHADRIDAAKGAMASGVRQVVAFAAAYVSLNAAMGLVRSGLNLVRDGIRAIAMEGSDKQQALAQLEATLASTGRQAEFTTQQLLDMADAMEASSMLTAEQVQSAQARLLSYTDVAANEFPRALQIAIDQQQRLGISAEASAEIVGRALQSPSKAMAALSRQGFTLEAGQQRLLKQLEATGRMAEAQSIIMDMLTEAYGGAAAAARLNTAAGLWKGITDRIGDFTSRVANSGAFDYIQRKLVEVSDGLDAMANDGRLDRLAQSLSDAFVSGSEALSQYVEKLATVDFEGLAARAARAAEQIGPAIESTVQAARVVAATLTTVWNGFAGTVNAAGAALVLAVQQTVGRLGLAIGQIAEMFGNSDLRAKADGLYNFLGELSQGYAEQAKTDYQQIVDAWDTTTEHVKAKAKEQTETISLESVSQADFVRQAVTSMQGALDQISAAKTVAQLRQVGDEMYAAYKRGDISQQEYSASSVELNRRLAALGGAAKSMAGDVGIAAESLKSLADVQRAISDAKTDRDIAAIRTALQALYSTGQVTAAQYNAELTKLNARQKELTQALQGSKKAQDDKNKSDQQAIVTSEQLRRESGKRMEAERKAGGAAMEQRRKESSDAKQDMGALEGFFTGVITRAREGAAGLSRAALEAFDALRGISTAAPAIDTSSLEDTRRSLEQVGKAIADVQAGLSRPLSGLGRWALETQRDSLKTQEAFLAQKASLQSLMHSYERGAISAQRFVKAAQGMKSTLGLLDDSDLSGLESAIDAATQRMKQMGDSTRSTLESLQDELDGLQGRQDDIERRRFAARQRELQAQLAEAQAGGDTQAVANAARALGLLRQIESESAQQRQAEEQKKRMEAQQATQPAATQQPAPAPSKVIRLEVPGRGAVNVGVSSDADEAKLLTVLEQAGLRSV
ncbi:phage tail length tape measure family protein [Pseudomonas berkeleyensis]|uniref:Phage tail length tape measure family protein n=1 Tax=Pseudomonas berkeleyensis TaxID=2726956 RepID=A0A7G5DTW8_9PSED|nr:phage tail length tape measure family protein [Pseudomonas berkeleyensis]QMV65193.1 phage tail length tape measure family protein [Pseudomonas berkeleyensis]WSO40666.1 phage tail length tape measure family protein [Pseudomonas berkeleyensis]